MLSIEILVFLGKCLTNGRIEGSFVSRLLADAPTLLRKTTWTGSCFIFYSVVALPSPFLGLSPFER